MPNNTNWKLTVTFQYTNFYTVMSVPMMNVYVTVKYTASQARTDRVASLASSKHFYNVTPQYSLSRFISALNTEPSPSPKLSVGIVQAVNMG